LWSTWRRRAAIALAALIIAAGAVYALWPEPVPVDVAVIDRGPLEVTVGEEGRTQVREVYVVSAPVAGRLLRSPREVGDKVESGRTEVAVIRPTPPEFLDERQRSEERARAGAAEAAERLAEAEVGRAAAELSFSLRELNRAQGLADTDFISRRGLEEARLNVDIKRAALATAEANLAVRRQELESARARLIEPGSPELDAARKNCCITVMAPADGVVLKMITKSEQVVGAGTPLLEIGDPTDLEIVVELLTIDAVKVTPGDRAIVEGWGGEAGFEARVRRIDPAGFQKVSALGIEEQRVTVVLDPAADRAAWSSLGHDYRVFVRIVIWHTGDTLRVPLSALFRDGEDWAVFVLSAGRAVLRHVGVGRRNDRLAEVTDGLSAGETILVHPSDRVDDGVRVVPRADE
jgi:HlyD family secretion protein